MNKKFWSVKRVIAFVLGLVVLVCIGFDIYSFSPKRLKDLYTGEQEIDESEDKLISVGFCQVGSESVWRTANTNSIRASLTEDKGFFLRFSNARQKQENQIKTLRKFISQKMDYIVFTPVQVSGWDTVLAEAKNAGIPVIVVDRMIETEDEDSYSAFVGSDMYEEGHKAGVWLEEYWNNLSEEKEELNIVVLTGTKGSSAEMGRSSGFLDVVKGHSQWNVLECVDGDFTTSKGKEVMKELISKYDKIDVVISQNDDMTFGAVEALDEAGISHGPEKDVAIVSFDGVKEALRMVRDGKINADIECNPIQGDMIVDIILKMEDNQAIDKITYMEDKIFTIYNVNAYLGSRSY